MKLIKIIKKISCGYLLIMGISSASAVGIPQYQWLEYGPNDQWIARSVVSATSRCPDIITNQEKPISMAAKTSANENFPMIVCQAILPHTLTQASINHVPLSLPRANPKTIIIVGDSGCYSKNCQNPKRWPFPAISKQAALLKPDLIIHVGDYVYSNTKNSPNDTWQEWQNQFFRPAKPLLNTAPWIFARGNHESCDASGTGWEYLLDPFSFKHCFNRSPLYSVTLGNINLFVMDSSSTNDKFVSLNEVNWFSQYFFDIARSKTPYNWIITHKPIWFIHKNDSLNIAWQKHLFNTLQKAWSKIQPQNVNLILSGHIHRFEILNFKKSRPSQIIVGTSGASLDKTLRQTNLRGLISTGMPIDSGLSLNRFGFLVLKKDKDNDNLWSAQFYNPQGKIIENCQFDEKQVSCE